jgi:hypothetical protein
LIRACFCPLSPKLSNLYVRWLALFHSLSSLLRCQASGRPFDEKRRSAVWHEGSHLQTLKSPDFKMVGADGEDGGSGTLSERRQVVNLTIEDNPTDLGFDRRLRYSLQSCSYGLKHNRCWSGGDRGLNGFEQLLGLPYRVIIRVNNCHL